MQLSASSPNSYKNATAPPINTATNNQPQQPANPLSTTTATATPNTTGTQTATTSNTNNTGISNTGSNGIASNSTNSANSTTGNNSYQAGWSVPTVENEMAKLTSSDSMTMQQARNSGLRTAASRGLLNSSIAGQASEQAAIAAAAPMAEQNVSNQLNQQQFAQSVTANTQGQYMTASDNIVNQAVISINEIETAQNISQAEKDKMIANTIKRRDEDLKFMKSYYEMMPTWSGNWVNFPVMPSAPGLS